MVQDVRRIRPEVTLSSGEVAFRHLSDGELRRAYALFSMMRSAWLVTMGSRLLKLAFALKLPISWLVKKTLFRQFCGGETLQECEQLAENLAQHQVGAVLDYAVEGKQCEEDFEASARAIVATLGVARRQRQAFTVFKLTALARFTLLEKISAAARLSEDEVQEWQRVRQRVTALCQAAAAQNVRVLIDAEETWIQGAIDGLAEELMRQFNRQSALVYLTVQMYRIDRLAYLKRLWQAAKQQGWQLGVKLVRGAYMEKERERAVKHAYPSPIHATKANTDADYDEALAFCLDHLNHMALFAGTHNEASSLLLAQLVDRHGLDRDDQRVVNCQLLGMSDHLTFNLAHHGYNASKFIPFGPVKETLPYLIRRAEENSSLQSQSGREWSLLRDELRRRRQTIPAAKLV